MRNETIARIDRRQARALALVMAFTIALLAGTAQASGLQSASSAVSTFNTWLYSFLGIAAVTYLTYEGVKCWAGHHNWVTDFGKACILVAIVGSIATVLVPFLWQVFTS